MWMRKNKWNIGKKTSVRPTAPMRRKKKNGYCKAFYTQTQQSYLQKDFSEMGG